jgi:hypothetical protein
MLSVGEVMKSRNFLPTTLGPSTDRISKYPSGLQSQSYRAAPRFQEHLAFRRRKEADSLDLVGDVALHFLKLPLRQVV